MSAIDPESAREIAGRRFDEGYDCAESITLTFHELGALTAEQVRAALPMARGFGKGMGVTRGPCGALSGAVLVLGAADGGQRNQRGMYRLSGRFTKQFEKHFGAIQCRELLRNSPLSCREKTAETAALLAEYLNRHEKR
jgi:C_GCAxxG_C_C family probable redox protein